MRSAALLLTAATALAATCAAQNAAPNQAKMMKQGEQVFATTCATGYCHGVKGSAGGAPRLAARGFDQTYISNIVTRGVPGTGMASFIARLSQADLTAVVAYVATLNGIANPEIGPGRGAATTPAGPALSGEAARGERLFTEATRSFGRCSTCHEVGGLGIPVAATIAKVPDSAAALKTLATPNVKTAASGGESMPALVLSDGKHGTLFYDLTSAPPVQRNAEPGSVTFADGSSWRHSSVTGVYNDAELAAILTYLRVVIKP